MVLANKNLIIAGPRDVVNEEDIFNKPFDTIIQKKAAEQVKVFEGNKGSILQIISTENGKQIIELKLKSSPVFDGLAAGNGKLFMTTTDGKVLCFE